MAGMPMMGGMPMGMPMMGGGGGMPMMGGMPMGGPMQQQAAAQQLPAQQQQQQLQLPPLGPDGEMIDKIGSGINNRLHNMKASYKMFQDFVKLAVNYMQALTGSSACGRQMAAVLKKVSTGQGQPDIAQGFRQLAELQHSAESRYDAVLKAMQDDLLNSAQNVLTGGFKETCRFEQGFNQGYARARQEILALQPGSLNRANKVREVEDKLANNLDILRGLERKIYCNFLLLWTAVLDAQTAVYRQAADAYGAAQKQWTQLAVSGDRIAAEPVDYKKVLAERRGEVYQPQGGFSPQQQQQQQQMQQQQQQQQMMMMQQQQQMMQQQQQAMMGGGRGGGGGGVNPMMRQSQQPGALGAFWGGGAPPMMMMMQQQGFLPKGVPELPENMRGARLELQAQYKKIPKFDDLDESGLDAWELPDVGQQVAAGSAERSSTFSEASRTSSSGSGFGGGGMMQPQQPPMGGGGGGVMPGGGIPARPVRASSAAAVMRGGSLPKKKPADVLCYAKSLYAYKANNDDEHSFAAGEIFEVLSKDSENWWTARYNGVALLAPSNYLTEVPDSTVLG